MITIKILKSKDMVLTLEVLESDYAPKECFLYRIDIDKNPIYVNVCTLSDLTTYQTTTTEGQLFYRQSSMSKSYNTLNALETDLKKIISDIEELASDYKTYLEENNYDISYTYVIP